MPKTNKLPTTPVPARIIAFNHKTARILLSDGRKITLRRLCCMRVVRKKNAPWLSKVPFWGVNFPSNKQIVVAKIRVSKHRRRLCWAPRTVWESKKGG